MKLTMLGTGHAVALNCYNTCFALQEGGKTFLVDSGGGNTILKQLRDANIPMGSITDIFVTHKHTDHITGMVWMLRAACMEHSIHPETPELNIYGHSEVVEILRFFAGHLLQARDSSLMGTKIHLISVEDGDKRQILGRRVTFFDIHSTKDRQFGFTMELAEGEKLTCCGDEPYNPTEEPYARGSKWLLHEAFCLYSQREKYHPYEKHHSTVRDACMLGEELGVENLILYHTEDDNLPRRKELYTAEGKHFFHGNLLVPDDLEEFLL